MCCFGTYSLTSKEKFIPFGLLRKTSIGWRINPPNHLQEVPWHYHGNESRLLCFRGLGTTVVLPADDLVDK